jgi:phosphatidylglycerophosphate synthase
MCPYAKKYDLTPNILTTISLIFCGISVLLLLNKKYLLASFMYLISYYFDCMDGHFARKYNMVTKFGDYYDHVADLIKVLLILYVLYLIDSKKFFIILPFLIFFILLSFVHLGCQELYYDTLESDILSILKNICPVYNKDDKSMIINTLGITRYFGCGTFTIFIMLSIIFYGVNK